MTATVRPLTHNQPYFANVPTTVSVCAAKVAMSSSVARQILLSDRKWKMHVTPARGVADPAREASHPQEVEVEAAAAAAVAVVSPVKSSKSSMHRTLQNWTRVGGEHLLLQCKQLAVKGVLCRVSGVPLQGVFYIHQ